MDRRKESQQPHRRQRRFRFIQNVQSVSAKSVQDNGEKAFAVGLLMQRHSAVAVNDIWRKGRVAVHRINIACHIVEAFGAQEKTVSGVVISGKGDILIQFGMGVVGGEVEVSRSAFRVETGSHRDRFQKCGFPCSVFSHKKRDRRVKFQRFPRAQMLNHRKVTEIGSARGHLAQTNVSDIL